MKQVTIFSGKKTVPLGEGLSVHRQFADGNVNIVCDDVPASLAVREFWRCCNNVSAISGIVTTVLLMDGLDHACLAWEHGKGYTYDGQTYHEHPATLD